jgi:hypothetical protein
MPDLQNEAAEGHPTGGATRLLTSTLTRSHHPPNQARVDVNYGPEFWERAGPAVARELVDDTFHPSSPVRATPASSKLSGDLSRKDLRRSCVGARTRLGGSMSAPSTPREDNSSRGHVSLESDTQVLSRSIGHDSHGI